MSELDQIADEGGSFVMEKRVVVSSRLRVN